LDVTTDPTPDEAVEVALWNNPEFQVSASALGFARADLLEAGLLRNPVLSLLFPLGTKQLEATLKWPVEVLWERPKRVAAARLSTEAAAERLVQAGLDLAAAVKTAFLAPIAMTALVTGLALVPIIVGGNRSGHEIEHPMAVVILGGLFTSTLLNLFLLPAIYLRFGERRGRGHARTQSG
jgi:hypothetical protein